MNKTPKQTVMNILGPLWIYEILLGVTDILTGWPLFWLIVLTVLGSVRWTFTFR